MRGSPTHSSFCFNSIEQSEPVFTNGEEQAQKAKAAFYRNLRKCQATRRSSDTMRRQLKRSDARDRKSSAVIGLSDPCGPDFFYSDTYFETPKDTIRLKKGFPSVDNRDRRLSRIIFESDEVEEVKSPYSVFTSVEDIDDEIKRLDKERSESPLKQIQDLAKEYPWFKYVFRSGTTLLQVLRSRTWADALLTLYNSHLFPDTYQVDFTAFIVALQVCYNWYSTPKATSARVVFESGFFTTLDNLLPDDVSLDQWSEVVFDTKVGSAFQYCLITMASLHLFPYSVATTIYTTFGFPPTNILELLGATFKHLRTLISSAALLETGKVSIWDVLTAKDDFSVLIKDAELLSDRSSRIITGITPDVGDWIQRKDWFDQYTDLKLKAEKLSASKHFQKYVLGNKNRLERLRLILKKLEVIHHEELIKAASAVRVPPVGFLIVGAPAIGKSNLINIICAHYAKAKGITFKPDDVWSKCMASEYFEGYNPLTKPYIHLSELGNISKELASKQGDPNIQLLTSLLDSVAMPLNMAFEGKGKVYALPDVVIGDTNNPSLNAEQIVSNKAALLRRFDTIFASVLPEYRVPIGPGIDFDKSAESDKPIFDKWTFRVCRNIALDAEEVQPDYVRMKDNRIDLNIYELLQYIYDKSLRHIKTNSVIYNVMQNPKSYDGYIIQDHEKGVYAKSIQQMSEESKILFEDFSIERSKWVDSLVEKVIQANKSLLWPKLRNVFYSGLVFSQLSLFPYFYKSRWDNRWTLFFSMAFFFNGHLNPLVRFFTFTAMLCYIASGFMYERLLKIKTEDAYHVFSFHWVTLREHCKNMYDKSYKYVEYVAPSYYGHLVPVLFALGGLVIALYTWNKKKVSSPVVFSCTRCEERVLKVNVLKEHKCEENPVLFQNLHASSGPIQGPMNQTYGTLDEIEKSLGCAPSFLRVKNKLLPDAWNPLIRESHILSTDTVEDFYKSFGSNERKVIIRHDNTTKDIHQFVLGIQGGFAIVNTHAVYGFNQHVDFYFESTNTTERLFHDHMKHLGNDVTVLQFKKHLFKNLLKHVPISSPDSFSGILSDKSVSGVLSQVTLPAFKSNDDQGTANFLNEYYKYSFPHYPGLCGKMLIARYNGGSAVVAIHTAGDNMSQAAYGVTINRKLIEDCINSFDGFKYSSFIFPVEVTDPVAHSAVRFEQLAVPCYGKLPGPVLTNKQSKVCEAPLYNVRDQFDKVLDEVLHFKRTKEFGPPLMRRKGKGESFISPYNRPIAKFGKNKATIPPKILKMVKKELFEEITSQLPDLKLNPLLFSEAINGSPDNPFIRGMNTSTSAGYGWKGKKGDYIKKLEDLNITKDMIPELEERVKEIVKRYQEGEISLYVTRGCLKDEPRELSKILAGKTRMFYISPVEAIVIQRMVLAPFYSLMVAYNDIFSVTVGIDMHREAHILHDKLKKFSPFMLDGDFGDFDINMCFDLRHLANELVFDLLRYYGYSDEAMELLRGVLTDDLFPLIEVLTDLYLVAGLQPSGKYGTCEGNCLIGNILVRVAFYCLQFMQFKNFDLSFRDNVLNYHNGDDLILSVKELVIDWFNNRTMAYFCKQYLDMAYTDAHKSVDMAPYVALKDIVYLKRNFIYNKKLNRIVGALDLDSICRSLLWWIPSRSVTNMEQCIDTVNSALLEFFMHTEEDSYNRIRDAFILLYSSVLDCDAGLLAKKFFCYEELFNKLRLDS